MLYAKHSNKKPEPNIAERLMMVTDRSQLFRTTFRIGRFSRDVPPLEIKQQPDILSRKSAKAQILRQMSYNWGNLTISSDSDGLNESTYPIKRDTDVHPHFKCLERMYLKAPINDFYHPKIRSKRPRPPT